MSILTLNSADYYGELQRDVEKQLQAVEIRVAPAPKENGAAKPLLYLVVGIIPLEHFPVYSVTVSLVTAATSMLGKKLGNLYPTHSWEEATTARAVDVSELALVQYDVGSLVDHFTKAYREENQR